jgi:small-conductance mechanosensitive channel
MNIRDILNFPLITTEKFKLTPFGLIEVFAILLITWIIVHVIKRVFNAQVKNKKMDVGLAYSIHSFLKYVLWILAIVIVFDNLGIKVTILLAGSAALLVGIGFGLQEIFKDTLSGIFLIFDRSIEVGNIVELENVVGRVTSIGLRTSKVITRDNITIIIPNSKFIEEEVINWSAIDVLTRFHVSVGVAYGSDVRLVEKVLLGCARNEKDVSDKNEPMVRFDEFGDSSLDFKLFFWTHKSFEVEIIKSNLRFAIDKAFRENNIKIPFPQRDVYIKER